MMFGTEFYPTPPELIDKMLAKVDFEDDIKTVLEPSAGKGDIASRIREKRNSEYYEKISIDTIELDENLRHILKGNKFNVVHDDFLSFQTFKRYDLVVMNPPFSDGDKHLMKALEVMKYGGQIVCLLNAATLRNPYTMLRKELVKRLEELNADIEYLPEAFAGAERKTDVEIAMISVTLPKTLGENIILEHLKKATPIAEDEAVPFNQIIPDDYIQGLVSQYNAELAAGMALLNSYWGMSYLMLPSKNNARYSTGRIIELNVCGGKKGSDTRNRYLESVRYKYWEELFGSKKIRTRLTSNLQETLSSKLDEFMDYDFSFFNISQLLMELSKQTDKGIESTILELFDDFVRYSMDDKTNVHLYSGWKTNSCFKVGKKVIIPYLSAWGSFSSCYSPNSYKVTERLADIEKVFDFLDGNRTTDVNLDYVLKDAKANGVSRGIPTKYFLISFYKKGTCHLEFLNLDLLKKFNLFGSQRKNWLPPNYGKKAYTDLSSEERAVVDAYEGRESYDLMMKDRDYYLVKENSFAMLGAGMGTQN